MAKIIDDDFMVCFDCFLPIVNDDYSALDYYYSEEGAARKMKDIKDGIKNAGGDIVYDGTEDDEFSRRVCDCCGVALAGKRYHCAVLS